ncbi:hypothetical protein BIW11_05460 [Tropilaelaps mercedesae]|uniref:Uncharacterized protein n=1 Tax=Tropilaelaps mercedesae TaxID=418985 RepID=A0A1V9Y269_9ACAR|nr:hypothetical protein BIW11_05460 [Tropilaelaps mercedesae]
MISNIRFMLLRRRATVSTMYRRDMVKDRNASDVQSRQGALAVRGDNIRNKIHSNLPETPGNKAIAAYSPNKVARPKAKETPDERKARLERYRSVKKMWNSEQKAARLKTPAFKVGIAKPTTLKENKSTIGGLSRRMLNFETPYAASKSTTVTPMKSAGKTPSVTRPALIKKTPLQGRVQQHPVTRAASQTASSKAGLGKSASNSTTGQAETLAPRITTTPRTLARPPTTPTGNRTCVVLSRTTPQPASSKTPCEAPKDQRANVLRTTPLIAGSNLNQKTVRTPASASAKRPTTSSQISAPQPATSTMKSQPQKPNVFHIASDRQLIVAAALKKTRTVAIKRLSTAAGLRTGRERSASSTLTKNPKSIRARSTATGVVLRSRAILKRPSTVPSMTLSAAPTIKNSAVATCSPKPATDNGSNEANAVVTTLARSQLTARKKRPPTAKTEKPVQSKHDKKAAEEEMARKWAELLAHIKAQKESS